MKTVYLSLQGNDTASGLDRANAVRTPAAAQLRARETGAERIVIGDGIYYLDKPLYLTAEDGNRTWCADEGAKPCFSGGVVLSGVEDNGLYRAECEFITRDLFMGDKRLEKPRFKPETVSFTAEGAVFANLDMIHDPRSVEMVLNNFWNQPRICGQSIEKTDEGVLVRMRQPGWATYMDTATLGGAAANPSQVDYLENAVEFFNGENQWCFVERDGEIVYNVPGDVTAGVLEQLMVLDRVENLTVSGIAFKHTTWLQASTDDGFLTIQANFRKATGTMADNRWDERNWVAPSAAVYGENCTNVVFENNLFTQLGNGGIHLGRGSVNCKIINNEFIDCAATPVTIGGFGTFDRHPERSNGTVRFSDGNLIENNLMSDVGNHGGYAASVGICGGYVRNTVVRHNTIEHMPYSGMSFGWGWAWGGAEHENNLTGNVIENNYLSDMMNILFDGGGIYLLGRQDGLKVRNNYIADVNNDYGAIYLDNGCQGFEVTNNVIDGAHRNYIYKGDHHHIHDNYCRPSRKEPDLPMPELCDEHNPDLIVENLYLWDDEAVAQIRTNAGRKSS